MKTTFSETVTLELRKLRNDMEHTQHILSSLCELAYYCRFIDADTYQHCLDAKNLTDDALCIYERALAHLAAIESHANNNDGDEISADS